MTTAEFAASIQHRVSILRALEYRAKRADALGLHITGWILTRDEAHGLAVWEGCVTGPSAPGATVRAKVKKIIPHRLPLIREQESA
jgi:hypothetical protein